MKTAKKIRKFIAKDVFSCGGYTKEEVANDLASAKIKISVEYANGVVDIYDVIKVDKIVFNEAEGKGPREE
jgi:hypothetical protein